MDNPTIEKLKSDNASLRQQLEVMTVNRHLADIEDALNKFEEELARIRQRFLKVRRWINPEFMVEDKVDE